MVRENNQIDNYTYIYNYDNYGNRVSMKYYSFRSGNTSLGTLYETQLFTYHSIWKDKIQSYSMSYEFAPDYNYSKTYYYDNSGNITLMDDSRGTTKDIVFSWEGRHLSSYTSSSVTATYTYNQSGIRDAKTVNGITTEYVLDETRVIYEKTGSTEIYYTYDVDGSLLSMIYNGTEYFYVFNVFGDITHFLDSNGNVVVEYRYDAYGNIKYKTPSSQLADANPYRYRGYRYDEETNLYYLQSRYYNPETGRFINADGMLKASNTVLGHNMFTYTENNPVMNVDLTGYAPCIANPDEIAHNGISCKGPAGRRGYWAPYDAAISFDVSVSFPKIGKKFGPKIGVSFIISNEGIEAYIHGGAGGLSSGGVSTSIGVVTNYNEFGDYYGEFYYAEGAYGLGAGHSTSSIEDYEDSVRATYFIIGTPYVSGGVDYYVPLSKEGLQKWWNDVTKNEGVE